MSKKNKYMYLTRKWHKGIWNSMLCRGHYPLGIQIMLERCSEHMLFFLTAKQLAPTSSYTFLIYKYMCNVSYDWNRQNIFFIRPHHNLLQVFDIISCTDFFIAIIYAACLTHLVLRNLVTLVLPFEGQNLRNSLLGIFTQPCSAPFFKP